MKFLKNLWKRVPDKGALLCIKCNKEVDIAKDKYVRVDIQVFNRQAKKELGRPIIEPSEMKIRINLEKEEVNIIKYDDIAQVNLERFQDCELLESFFFVCWKCFTTKDFSMGMYRFKRRLHG